MSRRSRAPGPIQFGSTRPSQRPQLADWIRMPLDKDLFQQHNTATWTLSNPDAYTLRATKSATTTKNINDGTQDGMFLIMKDPVSPWAVERVAGFTDDKWRGEHAIFKICTNIMFGASDGGFPNSMFAGVGVCTYTSDQSGTPGGPAFGAGVSPSSWYVGASVIQRTGGDDQWNPAWTGCGMGAPYSSSAWEPTFGDPEANANRVELSVGYRGKYGNQDCEVQAIYFDETSPSTAPVWGDRFVPVNTTVGHVKFDGKFMHPLICFANWDTAVVGDFVEVTDVRYLIQQISQRGSD